MQSEAYFRTADRNQYLDVKHSGFIVRRHTPANLLSHFFMVLSVVILAIVGVLYYDMLTGFYICFVSGIMMFFISKQLQLINRNQLSSEFINAAFSSVISKDYRFCFIARYDGEIVYLNRQFQDMFPGFLSQPSLNTATLCNMQSVPHSEWEKLAATLVAESACSFPITMKAGADNRPHIFTLQIEPISTPRGYVLIRAT